MRDLLILLIHLVATLPTDLTTSRMNCTQASTANQLASVGLGMPLGGHHCSCARMCDKFRM